MNEENIKRQKIEFDKNKNIKISIRLNKDVSEWLKSKSYSPTGIFYEALKQLKCPHIETDKIKKE